MESARFNLQKQRETAFQDVKDQIANKEKGLTKQSLHLLRHYFIDLTDKFLPEIECLGYLEALTLDPTHTKSISKLRSTFDALYTDLINLYVNKRANRASALFRAIQIETLLDKKKTPQEKIDFIDDFQQLAAIVAYDILSKPTHDHALLAADRWMQIQQLSLENRYDFQTILAINGGLYSISPLTGDNYDLLAQEAQKTYERINNLQIGNNMVMRALTIGASIPYLGTYQSDIEFASNQQLDNDNNATTENIEVKNNTIEKLKFLQNKLEDQEIVEKLFKTPEQALQQASSTPELTTIQNAFDIIAKEISLFSLLPDAGRKCEFILTALALKQNAREFLLQLFEQIKTSEWEVIIQGICKNLIFEKNSPLQKLFLKTIEDTQLVHKKRVEMLAMIDPDMMAIYLQQLQPNDQKEVIINLSKISTLHADFVKEYIESIKDQTIRDELTKELAIIPSSPNFVLLTDGKSVLWELLSKRILKEQRQKSNLAIARDLIPSISNKNYASAKLENILVEARKYSNQKVDQLEGKLQRNEIIIIVGVLNGIPEIQEKIKYLESVVKAGIRPISKLNNSHPHKLSEEGIKILKKLRDAFKEKKFIEDAAIEKYKLALEKEKSNSKTLKGKSSLQDVKQKHMSEDSRTKSMGQLSKGLDSSYNENNAFFKDQKKHSTVEIEEVEEGNENNENNSQVVISTRPRAQSDGLSNKKAQSQERQQPKK